jgi:plasmid stabilization system protein ParE
MPVPIQWLRAARQNLDDEATYIAQDDAAAASRVVARVLEAVAQLAQQPGLGRPGRVPGTRELVVLKTPYLVPYIVDGDQVIILRVFHISRRLPKRC